MSKNIVVCLDGTNNKVRAAANTNVIRMFDLLDLSDPSKQVAYYSPGVGTFSSPAAWSPPARTLSRYFGLAFGAGLRQNLGDAYRFLMDVWEPGDRIFVFGFSRGAYTARALTGMLEVFGLFRRGTENLVPFAVAEYAKQQKKRKRKGPENDPEDKEFWKVLREYARIFGRDMGEGHKGHATVHFLGIWDTVKAAGDFWRQFRWPFTVQLPHVKTIRHAIAIDERRRAYAPYFVGRTRNHLIPTSQNLEQVWFAGVHSDVGGMFNSGARLSDIPLKWMAQNAVKKGLIVRDRAYEQVQEQVTDAEATGAVHTMGWAWALLGSTTRHVQPGAKVHASVARRIEVDPSYAKRLPPDVVFVDKAWNTRGAKSGGARD